MGGEFFWSVLSLIRTEHRTEKTPYLDTFQAVQKVGRVVDNDQFFVLKLFFLFLGYFKTITHFSLNSIAFHIILFSNFKGKDFQKILVVWCVSAIFLKGKTKIKYGCAEYFYNHKQVHPPDPKS